MVSCGTPVVCWLAGLAAVASALPGHLPGQDAVPQEPQRKAIRYSLRTVAGTDAAGFSGDGGPAAAARLHHCSGVAVAPDGAVYIADYGNDRVRRVDAAGTIRTFAGTGERGGSGDGGPALAARLHGPYSVRLGPNGDVFIADAGNGRVRRVDRGGIITTVAGGGGDESAADRARLRRPVDVAWDREGDLLIADSRRHQVLELAPDGALRALAGTGEPGYAGDGAPAGRSRLAVPGCLAGAAADGSLWIADLRNHAVRRIAPDGRIHTMGGTGEAGFADGIPARRAAFNEPAGVAVAAGGVVFVADGLNHRVRRIDGDGIVETIAGSGREGRNGSSFADARDADLGVLDILTLGPDGEQIFVADYGNHRIVVLTPVYEPEEREGDR